MQVNISISDSLIWHFSVENIGADIIMQLDDVVHSSVTGPRVEEAMNRFACFGWHA